MTKTLKAVAASPRTSKTSKTAASAPRVSPGLARLRAHKDAEAIRAATLADNEAARAEIAAKLAEAAPVAADEDADKDVPAFLKASRISLTAMADAVNSGEKIEVPEPAPAPAKPARQRKASSEASTPRERRPDGLLVGSKAAQVIDLARRFGGVSHEELVDIASRATLITYYAWDGGYTIEKREGRYFAKRIGHRALAASDARIAKYYKQYGFDLSSADYNEVEV